MIKNVFIGIAFVTGVAGLTIALTQHNTQNKFVYIEMGRVYDEFTLSKELNKELQTVLKARAHITDSLLEDFRKEKQDVKQRQKKSIEDIQRLAKIEEEYLYKKQLFEKDNQILSAQYNNKIWNQINQFVHDFGEGEELSLIFGANGQGNIMYGAVPKNMTKEVIEYINSRYNGKEKGNS